MEILNAIILGIVEGLTEFLPISSTGHLIVAADALDFYDASRMFTVVIQMGAIAAVMWFYRQHLLGLVKGLINGDKKARRFWFVWVIATIPAGLTGLLFDATLDTYAISLTVALALIIGGIVMWLIEAYVKVPPAKKDAQLDTLTTKQAILVGCYQIIALIPGVSRSGATIMGGLLTGLDRVTATTFSFYLGIPILLVAGIYKLLTDDISSVSGGMAALVAGSVASFITALIVVGWLLRYVSKHDFKPFAYYRIGFGVLILVLIATGMLD